jgi:putative nucleotidyltransferase with HDIG domain
MDKIQSKFSPKILLTFLIFAAFCYASLILPFTYRQSPVSLSVGSVSTQDIRAPQTFSFISETLTENARDQAEQSVMPIYLAADPTISRQQLERMKAVLNYVSSVRSDEFATQEQKIADLQAIDNITITTEMATNILTFSQDKWQEIQNETLFVLEEVMRSTIREDQITQAKRSVLPLISYSFTSAETEVINSLVTPMVTANSLFSSDKTNEAIEQARAEVEPVSKTYMAGETIVSTGQVITPVIWEALQELGLISPQSTMLKYISSALLIFSVVIMEYIYVFRYRKNLMDTDFRSLVTILALYLVFLYLARIFILNRAVVPYIFPIAAFGLTISSLINYEVGIIFSIGLSTLTAYGQSNSVELTLFYIIASIVAIFILQRGRRITVFFYSGLVLGLVGAATVVSYRLISAYFDMEGILTLIGASFLNGMASVSLTLILQYAVASLLGKTTALQLMDLSRPDHPLLQLIMTNAPGTYQHSLQVANLAEQAARSIDADPLLTRVGALYHDAGKALNPAFFIENQVTGNLDAHDDLDPAETATTIIKHVEDGLKLAHEYRLPPEVETFISEHHGKSTTKYQLSKAKEQLKDGKEVDLSKFEYPGPNPHTRETAILMMADKVEARARAEIPKTDEEITKLVETSIDTLLHDKFLDNTSLSMKNIQAIKESFFQTLKNTYHHRLKYPK